MMRAKVRRCFKVLTIRAALPPETTPIRRRTHNAGSISLIKMPTMEHSTPPNIVDVPTDLSTPFDYLMNSDTDAGQR
jgi:hypothetical protein